MAKVSRKSQTAKKSTTAKKSQFSNNSSFYQAKTSPKLSQKHQVMKVEALDDRGAGIAYIKQGSKNLAVFIEGALVGETVRVQLIEQKAKYARAKLIAVEKTSELDQATAKRIDATCPHYQECGGCQLQHMSHQAQVEYKSETLKSLFQKMAGHAKQSLSSVIESQSFGYRRRVRISLLWDAKSQSLEFGFRKANTNQISMIETCPVLVPEIEALILPFKQLLSSFESPQSLGHLELVFDGAKVTALLRHVRKLAPQDHDVLLEFAKNQSINLYLQADKDKLEQVYGEPSIYQEAGVEIAFLPTDFIQVNQDINQKMINQAIEYLDLKPSDRVLDLFCGLGNFSLPIAKQVAHVVGVEGVDAMVARANQNAERNGIANIDFYQANLELSQKDTQWAMQKFDKIILDPARAGASGALEFIAQMAPERIVYISCNPATLARDSQELSQFGYQVEKLSMLDMFPQTKHLESMALFVKTNKPRKPVSRKAPPKKLVI